MPSILTRNSTTSNHIKFRTVLGLSALANHPDPPTTEHQHTQDNPLFLTKTTSRKKISRQKVANNPDFFNQDQPSTSTSPMPGVKHELSTRRTRGARQPAAQDGPWSVSAAEAGPRSYTLYIKTSTHHLTLTRSANEIAELHGKIHEYVPPNTPLPVCPLSVDTTASNGPTKRKSSFLTTLSRLASPPPRVTPLPPLASTTPEDEEEEPLAAPAVAAYLNTLANDQHVRVTRPWKRFVRVRTEDLQSTRVERAIKRVRSDVAMHTSTAGITSPPPLPPSTGPSSIMSVEAVPPPAPAPHEEEGEPLVSQEVLDAIETGTKPEDKSPPQARPTSPQTHLHPHPQLQPRMETPTSTQVVSPTPVHADPKPVRMEDLEPVPAEQPDMDGPQLEQEEQQEKEKEKEHPAARIPRSLSADPDKAARLSRMFTQPPAHEAAPRSGTETETETETEGEGGETDIQTDANAQSDATNGASQRDKTMKKKKKKVAHARKSSRKVVIDDFEMMRVLGKGCAGKVLLVRQKASNELYALKAITKKHVLAHQELQHTLTEQAVLKRMAHEGTDPFVVRLWWSFHDRENLFLVMDFHPGGDLATQLARWGRLGRDRARFYAAEIVEGVEGLHAAGVIYRDLKPENILIGGDGHIVLTDFGLSKEFPQRHIPPVATAGNVVGSSPATPTGEKHTVGLPYWMNQGGTGHAQAQKDMWLMQRANDQTSTFCGTAEYLAPEVIQGLQYSYEVDWWSFGTMLYEMLTGITPFWANNHSDMYVRVLQDELTFPEDKAMDQDTKSLIRGLLQRNPALRLSEPRIKRHPYFSMIDWQHVYHKRYIPPYIPPIDPSNASDTQNFDDTFLDMEPVLDSELENNDATDSERERSATGNGTDGEAHSGDAESSIHASSSNAQSRSPSKPTGDDVFDGYSFKGRHSVIIDGEDEGHEGTDEEDEKPEEPVPEEDGLDPGQKTPEVGTGQPTTPTAASAVAEAFRKKLAEAAAKAVEEDKKATGTADERPTTPSHVKPASIPPASPEKDLPPPPVAEPPVPVAPAKEKTQGVPPALPNKEKAPAAATATAEKPKLDKPKPKIVEQLKARARPRRERSGVAALDRGLSDVIDEDEENITEREDDDWDFVEAPGAEDVNGVQGKSLFARGVVDRYRLAVFRKAPSSSRRSMPRADSTDYLESPASPSVSERKKTKGSGMSFGRKTFLRPKSPPATWSTGPSLGGRTALSHSHSATISASSTGLLTPSTSTAIPTMPTSLKSRPSMASVGSKPGSSDTSVNGDLSRLNLSQSAAELASPSNMSGPSVENGRRPPRMSVPEDDQRNRGLKKVRKYTTEGAEKVMSLFSSPKSPPGTSQ